MVQRQGGGRGYHRVEEHEGRGRQRGPAWPDVDHKCGSRGRLGGDRPSHRWGLGRPGADAPGRCRSAGD